MPLFRVANQKFFDGFQQWPVGSVVDIKPADYERLLSESFEPADTEAAQALIDFHLKHHEEKPISKPPQDPSRLDFLERAKKRLPADQSLQDARDAAEAEEQAARQAADAEAATNPDKKAAAEAKRKAYAEAAQAKADALKQAEDQHASALEDQSRPDAETTEGTTTSAGVSPATEPAEAKPAKKTTK